MKRNSTMYQIFRVIWRELRIAWVDIAETAPGRGERSVCKLVAVTLSLMVVVADAAPLGGQVVSGAGSISQSSSTTTIAQSSQNLSLNWDSFNIAPQEAVNFQQPSTSAIAVNRIFDTNGTQILGQLNANGQVYLINPNGILFGQGAQVNVGGLVASTLELNVTGLDGNTRTFSGNGSGSIINLGSMNAADGGYLALLGNHVSNQGTMTAYLGSVALGAGSAATLTFSGNSLVHMQVDQSILNSLAENGGLIRADGGMVVMTAGAKNTLLASVVNNTGVIEARTVENRNGVITLLGGMVAGTVNVGGTLDASASNGGNGGFVETSAAHVKVAHDVKVTTAATNGRTGNWLIDPQDYTVAASGGDITGADISTSLGTTNVEVKSSTGGTSGSGNVNVNDAVSWSANTILTLTAANDVNVNADITATGNTAGLIINPDTANGADAASGTGVFKLNGAVITLSGTSPSLAIAGETYTVINDLGAEGSTTAADLQGMNGDVTANYALGSNINAAATSGWNAGAGFVPIGNAIQFSGVFDGLGHTISNLVINPGTNSVGLFGNTNGANLQNVGLVDITVTGGVYTGALVGNKTVGNISDAYSTGMVRGTSYVGGLVGLSNGGNLTNTYSTAAVFGTSNLVGGLVGQARFFGTIINSYATGAVSASSASNVGGLVGQARFVNLINTYATGAVAGNSAVGGLVGFLDGTSMATSYSAGAVSGNASVGGLVGQTSGSVTNNSYWNVTRSGRATSAGGTGLTDAQMFIAANFPGFSFTSTPGLTGNNWVIVDADGSLNNAAGAAGATFPMLASEYSTTITNAHQLQLMAMAPAASYTLGNDVNAAATALIGGISTDVWGSSGFAPIGNLATPFARTFDGLGHTVSTLTINLATPNVGLFGVTGTGAVIQNVGVVDASVTGGAGTGALVGYNGIGASISNSNSSGIVFGGAGTGGLVGSNTTGSISNSYSTSSVTGAAGSGGLAGSNTSGTISNSFATGSVTGAAGTGGLVGSSTTGSISYSYATGNVSNGGASTGGLIGSNTTGAISYSYATGNVTGGGADVGGLIGTNTTGPVTESYAAGLVGGSGAGFGGLLGSTTGLVIRSFWDTTTTTRLSSAGGGTGMTTAEMQTQANFTSATTANGSVDPTWDFANTWTMYEGVTYPLLSDFMTPLTVTANSDVKTYDGQPYSSGNGVTYSALVNGIAPAGTLSYSGTSQGAINADSYVITPGGLQPDQQYLITFIDGTLTIDQKALTLSGITADNKVYDAATTATVSTTGAIYTGLIGGDLVSVNATGLFSDKNVATGKTVTLTSGYTGADVGNYSITDQATTLADITPLAITGDITAADKVYDATNSASILTRTLTGAIAGDTVSYSGGTATFSDKNVDSGKIVTGTGLCLAGTDAGNYTVNTTPSPRPISRPGT